MDAVVAGTTDSQPPLRIVKARLPATPAVVYLRGRVGIATLATGAGDKILLTQF
jgi:hypothetical protein